MRLDKFLSNQGLGSRSQVQKLVKKGLVKINDEIVKDPSIHIDPSKDKVELEDKEISYKENYYFVLNKPAGYITATEDEEFPTVLDLFSDLPIASKLFPVGRLDIDTEGLLILTTDGQFGHRLSHPKWNIEKEYYVIVEGNISNIDFAEYENKGIYLKKEKYQTKPFKVKLLNTSKDQSEILITLTEGKYHIVKRIMQELCHPVLYLKRVRIGSLRLDEDLNPGEFRELTDKEIKQLKNLIKMND